MASRSHNPFTTIHTEGGLFPVQFLQRLSAGDPDIEGLKPEDFHLPGKTKPQEAITRSWNVLIGAWEVFKASSRDLPEAEPGTVITRKWLLALFQELGYGRLQTARALKIEDKEYPISHAWTHVPIHLVGFNIELDRRTPGVAGAARLSPHAMVQELLNRAGEEHLWAFLSNGHKLRILRDNLALTRQAYVEFDLQAMMDGEAYSDFVLLWLLCHQSRVESDRPAACWLEKWVHAAEQQGVRALDQLRKGVEKAIETLGSGFLAHPSNRALKDKLRSGELDKQEYYRQLLRTVYRIIFLFVAEDRELLFLPESDPEARARYQRYYSTHRLRTLAMNKVGSKHGDLWQMLQIVSGGLARSEGCPELALSALGGFLWSDKAAPDLDPSEIMNRDLLEAIRHLAVIVEGNMRRIIDYRNLGAEELGSIYEALLEMHPGIHIEAARFELDVTAGSERKTTGSYYTPTSLVNSLIDTALEPVIRSALNTERRTLNTEEKEQKLLGLKICDPACGSGHFLIAAAHRLAKHLAAVRTGEDEPSPSDVRHALRQVVSQCLYGVDINPMSVELCKISLWMEAMEPGKPLSFLDHHIQVGNSLIGATPGLMNRGIPDEAFKPIEGDDKKYCAAFKKQNKEEERDVHGMAQTSLFDRESRPWEQLGNLSAAMIKVDTLPDETPADIHAKEKKYAELVRSAAYASNRQLADAWCATFVWKKCKPEDGGFDYPITNEQFRRMEHSPHDAPVWMRDEIRRLADQYKFFHWHLAFPDVFQPLETIDPEDSKGWKGGFDVMLGNPPWERVKLQEKEWFAQRSPEIANAPNAAARKRLIKKLEEENPALYRAFLDDARKAEGESHILRDSGLYPLCGRGDVNLYAVFAELFRNRLSPDGRFGAILPSGIATDDTTKFYFQSLIENRSLISFYDFENKGIFPQVHSSYKFCLLTTGSGVQPTADAADFAFFCHGVEDLRDPDRRFTLSPEDILLLNPNTRTCPIFRSNADAELTKAIYRRVPVLIREARDGQPEENPWGITFNRMFDMSNDSHLFRTREQLEQQGYTLEGNIFRKPDHEDYLPLYEAKMIHHFDHRWATYVGSNTHDLSPVEKNSPTIFASGRYWVMEREVTVRLNSTGWEHGWLSGWRDITNTTNERTIVGGVFPVSGVGNNLPVWIISKDMSELFSSILSSFACDFVARFKLGGTHLNFFIAEQITMPEPKCITPLKASLLPPILELCYTAWDLQPFARDCDYDGPPFRWDEKRRFEIRCELDAAFFYLYLPATPEGGWKPARKADGAVRDETDEELAALKEHFPSPRDAVAYIMDTFPIVRRKDEKEHGRYRTKDRILEIYDAMAAAQRTGQPYQTTLNLPPADDACRHPKINVAILAYGSLINDPGAEISAKIKFRLNTETPFPVEYARISKKRGGAPTLVPHNSGKPVAAQILVLDDSVSVQQAKNMLYCREIHEVGSRKKYVRGTSPDSVLVKEHTGHPCVNTLLYTDFNPNGKTAPRDPAALAEAAIASVAHADPGKDGITYLRDNVAAGIHTPLANAYRKEILKQTNTTSLDEALEKIREHR